MKKILVLLLIFNINDNIAQNTVGVDSLKQIVLEHIVSESRTLIRSEDYGSAYEIRELLTYEPIQETDRKGIYYFGICGDDVPRWILLYDPWGYRILSYVFSYANLGDLLDFFERNQYSAEDAIVYLKAIYNHYRFEDSWGEEIIKHSV